MAVIKDKGRQNVHLFTPRILKRANIKRNEERGNPNRLKNKVTKIITPKKKINCFVDPDDPTTTSFFLSIRLVLKKS